MPDQIKLYLIPGTGTDYRMYTPQLEVFHNIIVPQWLPPMDLKEPLSNYARRLADTIDTSSPFILGGVSFGGMIAQEMALTLRPEGLILISTSSSSKAIPLLWRLSGKIMRLLPDLIVKSSFVMLGNIVSLTWNAHGEVYARMLMEMSPRLVRWQSWAATIWKLKGVLNMPVFHIHGEKDAIIPVKNVNAQVVIPGGGHLINITHEKQVNAFISDCLMKIDMDSHIIQRNVSNG